MVIKSLFIILNNHYYLNKAKSISLWTIPCLSLTAFFKQPSNSKPNFSNNFLEVKLSSNTLALITSIPCSNNLFITILNFHTYIRFFDTVHQDNKKDKLNQHDILNNLFQ